MSDIVNKLWGFCHTLRHDGIDYSDYIEQLTYLLFLKMAAERGSSLPAGCKWSDLKEKESSNLISGYEKILSELSDQTGLIGDIFSEAQSKFTKPESLRHLVDLIDEWQWTELEVDVKGAAFEGLLERAANEGKKGAGQYFTPRVLIETIVEVMRPDAQVDPEFTLNDPACGSGGFLVVAFEWLHEHLEGIFDSSLRQRLKTDTYFGQDLVARPRKLALMNLYLHGLEPKIKLGNTIYEPLQDIKYKCILSNPPFGSQGLNQVPERQDFSVKTSNKQLNFVQHILNSLTKDGRAAVVLPDNCLFGTKAGEVFRWLMSEANLHTILRLPRGTFSPYSDGVRANVLFFQKGYPTKATWVYDARSGLPSVTKKDRPLSSELFLEFIKLYGSDPNGRSKRSIESSEGRFNCFTIDEVEKRSFNLDFKWIQDNPENIDDPAELATKAIDELQFAINELAKIVAFLDQGSEYESSEEGLS